MLDHRITFIFQSLYESIKATAGDKTVVKRKLWKKIIKQLAWSTFNFNSELDFGNDVLMEVKVNGTCLKQGIKLLLMEK